MKEWRSKKIVNRSKEGKRVFQDTDKKSSSGILRINLHKEANLFNTDIDIEMKITHKFKQ